MKKILSKIFMIVGIFLLWMSVSGLFDFLKEGESVGNILASLSIALPLGLILRWVSLAAHLRKEKVIKILDNIFVMFAIRGAISLVSHSSYSLIFILIAVIGLYLLNRVGRAKLDEKV